jgi:hypothetical protein
MNLSRIARRSVNPFSAPSSSAPMRRSSAPRQPRRPRPAFG